MSELANLRARDVALPGDPRFGPALSRALLLLPTTKTGDHQSVEVRDPHLIEVLRRITVGRPPGASLMGRSVSSIRHHFNAAVRAAGLRQSSHTFHSLRHGGATHECLLGRTVETTLVLGRWRSSNMAAHCIQQGPSRLAATTAPPEALRIAYLLSPHWLSSLADAAARWRAENLHW